MEIVLASMNAADKQTMADLKMVTIETSMQTNNSANRMIRDLRVSLYMRSWQRHSIPVPVLKCGETFKFYRYMLSVPGVSVADPVGSGFFITKPDPTRFFT